MKHTVPFRTCKLCTEKIARALDQHGVSAPDIAIDAMRKHNASIRRQSFNDAMKSFGLKKNRYDGHWE